MPETSEASSNPQKGTSGISAAAPQSQDQKSKAEDANQPATAPEHDQKECTDQRTRQETDDKEKVDEVDVVATDDASNVDSEERLKLGRRKRRCPIVNVEKYVNNEVDEGEKKEGGAAGEGRSSFARTVLQEDVVEFLRLVQEGACVWDFDDHGWSPLHWACSRGSTIMTYAILQETRTSRDAGASGCEETRDVMSNYLNATEKLSGWTALHLAIIAGKLDVVYLLMEAGCDPQVKDKMGDRPINCIRRTRNLGGVAERLRNALLDLSDSEDSSCDEGTAPSVGQKKKTAAAGVARPLRRRA